MGLGPTEPCARLSQHPTSPWGLGRQRVDPGLWPGGHCSAANGSGSNTSSGLRTQLLCERLAPHRHHTQTHTLFTAAHIHVQTPRGAWAGGPWRGIPSSHPPHSVPTRQLSLSPLRTRLLYDVTDHTHGDHGPTGLGGRPLESSTEQDSCRRMHVTATPGLRWDTRWQQGHPGLSLRPLPRLDTVHLEPEPGLRSSAPRGWCVWPWGGRSRPAPWPPSRKLGFPLLSQSLCFCGDGRQLGGYEAGLLCLLRESM